MQRVYSSLEFPRFPGLSLSSLLTLAYRTVSSGWQRSNYLSSYVSMKPDIVNRTQSDSIMDWVRLSSTIEPTLCEFDF